MSHVMTVLGPIDSEEMGVTLPHEHIFINLIPEFRWSGLLHDPQLALEEVRHFKDSGGRTLVDCTTEEIGRDPLALQKIARESGLHIVMGSGHYRDPYLDKKWFDRHDVDAIAELIVRDIEDGVEETGVRAGIIGEIGSDKEFVSAVEERSFRAAARAHLRTGLAITTHAARWPVGVPQLEILEAEGVDPRAVIIGHCDTVPSPEYHEELARRGTYVQFDTIRGLSNYDTDCRVNHVLGMVRKGFLDQILISHDICWTSLLHANGGCGYDFILKTFIPRLLAAGLNEEEIYQMTVVNPRRALTQEQ